MTTYCEYCNSNPSDTFNRVYHDSQYGFPLEDDNLLFERLVLEINQAGLSWITILKKAENFRSAYSQFKIDSIAAYDEEDRRRLLNDPSIIRNRLKVNAAIENARRIQNLRSGYGSFKGWLDGHHPQPLDNWVKLFKRNFLFNEFLMSTGYLADAHIPDCPVYEVVIAKSPAWLSG
jgi:DNA-3-methyladenine glycosylase I